MKFWFVVFQKNLKISPINAKSKIFQVPLNLKMLKKLKTQELSLENDTLSDTFDQNTIITETLSETTQIQAVDPNNESE